MNLVSYLVISLFNFLKDTIQQSNIAEEEFIVEKDEKLEFDQYGNPMYLENSLLRRHWTNEKAYLYSYNIPAGSGMQQAATGIWKPKDIYKRFSG